MSSQEMPQPTVRSRAKAGRATDAGPDEAALRARAYQLWEAEGRPEGRAQIHWEQACFEAVLEVARGDGRTGARRGRNGAMAA